MQRRRGRPSLGVVAHVNSLAGPKEECERLGLLLSTLGGELTVKEASRRLEMSEARFHELRRQALAGALAALAPRPPGRPAAEKEVAAGEVEELRAQVRFLEEELQCARVRTEIALAMPHVLKRGGTAGPEKRGSSAHPRVPRRPTPGDRSAT